MNSCGNAMPRTRESREMNSRPLLEVPGCPPEFILSLPKSGHPENLFLSIKWADDELPVSTNRLRRDRQPQPHRYSFSATRRQHLRPLPHVEHRQPLPQRPGPVDAEEMRRKPHRQRIPGAWQPRRLQP